MGITEQLNGHVEVLADLLKEHSDNLSKVKKIGVSIEIPMGVRQRLIQMHGEQARQWLSVLESAESRDYPD